MLDLPLLFSIHSKNAQKNPSTTITLSPIAEPGSSKFIELAFVLAFMVGVLYLGIGIFGLGVVMYFISHSAVKGFTSAAALIIIATQLPHFLGVPVPRHEYIFPMLVDLLKSLPSVHVPTLAVGLLSVGIIYSIKKYRENWPAGLIALVITSGLLVLFELHEKGIAIVGKSPGGLPSRWTLKSSVRCWGLLL